MFLDQAKLSLVSTNANELTPGFLVSVMMNLYRGVEISQYRITVSGILHMFLPMLRGHGYECLVLVRVIT